MDLNRVRHVKSIYDQLPPEDKASIAANASQVKAAMATSFPAAPELDQAAFAWYLAETLETLRRAPVSALSNVLEESTTAYAMAAISLLGWADA